MLFERQTIERRKRILVLTSLAVLVSGIFITLFSFAMNRPQPIKLPGYTSPPGYQVFKSNMNMKPGPLYEEYNFEAEKRFARFYPGNPEREKQLNGRIIGEADSVWATAMPKVLPKVMETYPVDTLSTIMRMGNMLMTLTIEPDGHVSDVKMESEPDVPELLNEISHLMAALNFGPNKMGKSSVIPFTLAFTCGYIHYPNK